MLIRTTLAAAFLAALAPVAVSAAEIPSSVANAVADGGRPQWEVKRDSLDKPGEILAFSGIRSGDRVADLVAHYGYYTRLLAKLVGSNGAVYSIVPIPRVQDLRPARIAQRAGAPPALVPDDPAQGCVLGCYLMGRPPAMLPIDHLLAIAETTEYRNVQAYWESLGDFGGDFAVPEQLDAVFSAGGYHVLHDNGASGIADMEAFAKSVYGALKPGGVYVVVDNAATKGRGFADALMLGRVEEDAVKTELASAGFVLDAESTALANPRDDRSVVAGADYTGASPDRFVLRFKKPDGAPATDQRPHGADPVANYYGNTFLFNIGAAGQVTGQRERYTFYNPDHTYQEMGALGTGPGPFQEGTWFWDADGHNCMHHEFPLDERGLIVCHTDIIPRPIGVVQDETTAGAGTVKVEIVKGLIRP